MTLLWFDGFEGQDHTLTWTSVTSTWTNTATGTRLGYGRLIQSAGNSRSIQQTITASTDTYVGFAMKVTAIGDSFVDFYGDSNVTRHIRIAVAASGAIEIRNGATTTVLATSAATGLVVAGTWVYLEVHVKVSDTVGEVNVRVNGASTDAVSFSGDTKNAGTNTTIDSVRFLTPNAGSPIFALDDVYICNGLGSVNNGFLGDCRVQLSQPTGVGSFSGLTPSTGSNYQTVDEIPFSASDYSGSAVVGARDTYAMGDLVAGSQAPKGVRVVVGWHKSDAGAANMRRVMTVPGSSVPVSDNFNRSDGALGSTSTGSKAWGSIAAGGTWNVSSNAAAVVSGHTTYNWTTCDTGLSDCSIELTISSTSVDVWGIIFRATDGSNFLGAFLPGTSSNSPQINRWTAGTPTVLNTGSSTTCTAGDVIKVTLSGSSITVYKNGVSVVTATSTQGLTATKHGMVTTFFSTGAKYDNFTVTATNTTAYGSSTALPTSMAVAQELLETDPVTSAAWTASGFNAAEFGAEVS